MITRCLAALLEGASPGELDVVVVCNGCSDDTAGAASRFSDSVRVLETDVPSKSQALNLGDHEARGFPRFYLDADIELHTVAVRDVAEAMSGDVLAAAPRLVLNLEGASWLIRAYYAIWTRLPYFMNQMLGSGVYALSARGRARFEQFPEVNADDLFVQTLFSSEERKSVPSAYFLMSPPRSLHRLIAISARRRAGVSQLRSVVPESRETIRREERRQRFSLLALFSRPALWPALVVYVYAKTMRAVVYAWRVGWGTELEWLRDETSRS